MALRLLVFTALVCVFAVRKLRRLSAGGLGLGIDRKGQSYAQCQVPGEALGA